MKAIIDRKGEVLSALTREHSAQNKLAVNNKNSAIGKETFGSRVGSESSESHWRIE